MALRHIRILPVRLDLEAVQPRVGPTIVLITVIRIRAVEMMKIIMIRTIRIVVIAVIVVIVTLTVAVKVGGAPTF